MRVIGVLVALLIAQMPFPNPTPLPQSFELVAHRGVHQTFPLTNLTSETCTGEIIYPPAHPFIENTIPSMREAFVHGATTVELDIHRTADGHLVVFHDWTLDCRTDGMGVTNEQPLDYLWTLDVGYGYTADGGHTFPLRGTGVGMMPTLPEVLTTFPRERFVIDNKDGDEKTALLLAGVLQTLPSEQRARLSYWGSAGWNLLQERVPEVRKYLYTGGEARSCAADYLLRMLATGTLSDRCRQPIIGFPFGVPDQIPGWPNLVLSRAHHAGARVFITDVDTVEQLDAIKELPIDGIQTNRIEVIGPLVADRILKSE
ncbi:MAG: glycerophosphodiester phosphodiesterase family protein [Thermomicrobiales bacterium]